MNRNESFDDASCLLGVGCQINSWMIDSFLARGGFGTVFKAHDINTNEIVIIKSGNAPGKNYLTIESEIYQKLSGKDGFPRFIWSGIGNFERTIKGERKCLYCHILVIEQLGVSLSTMFDDMAHKFTLKTVLLLATQMIDLLETLHSVGVVHRDIKPSNFVLNEDANKLYLLDFGLSHFYKKGDKHIAYSEGVEFKGTHRYASLYAHLKIQQSRRDDLASLAYMLIYFLNGLPWQNVKVDRKDRRRIIGEIKSLVTAEELSKGLPDCFKYLLQYATKLKFDEVPDYQYMKNLFTTCLSELNDTDLRFEWEIESEKRVQSFPDAFVSKDDPYANMLRLQQSIFRLPSPAGAMHTQNSLNQNNNSTTASSNNPFRFLIPTSSPHHAIHTFDTTTNDTHMAVQEAAATSGATPNSLKANNQRCKSTHWNEIEHAKEGPRKRLRTSQYEHTPGESSVSSAMSTEQSLFMAPAPSMLSSQLHHHHHHHHHNHHSSSHASHHSSSTTHQFRSHHPHYSFHTSSLLASHCNSTNPYHHENFQFHAPMHSNPHHSSPFRGEIHHYQPQELNSYLSYPSAQVGFPSYLFQDEPTSATAPSYHHHHHSGASLNARRNLASFHHPSSANSTYSLWHPSLQYLNSSNVLNLTAPLQAHSAFSHPSNETPLNNISVSLPTSNSASTQSLFNSQQ